MNGSIAYVKGLKGVNIITEEEMNLIIEGLEKIKIEWKNNKFQIRETDEDIHEGT